MKTIGIIVAMQKEFAQLRNLLDNVEIAHLPQREMCLGQFGVNRIVLMQCGIGKVNAAIGTVEMINRYHPDLILSSGCAGGTGPLMNLTDIVAASETRFHDVYCGAETQIGIEQSMLATFKADEHALQTLQQLDLPVTLHIGTIVSGDWFVDSVEKMKFIYAEFPEAMAVDMESAAIAQACHIYGVPFLSLRVVSDLPLQENQQEQYAGFWDKVASNSFEVVKTLIESL